MSRLTKSTPSSPLSPQMSWMGKVLLARAALKAFLDFKAARSRTAAAPIASQEVEVSAKHAAWRFMSPKERAHELSGSETSPV